MIVWKDHQQSHRSAFSLSEMQNRPHAKLRHETNHSENVPLTEFLYLYSPRVCTGTYSPSYYVTLRYPHKDILTHTEMFLTNVVYLEETLSSHIAYDKFIGLTRNIRLKFGFIF